MELLVNWVQTYVDDLLGFTSEICSMRTSHRDIWYFFYCYHLDPRFICHELELWARISNKGSAHMNISTEPIYWAI